VNVEGVRILQLGRLNSGALRVVTSTANVLEVIKHGLTTLRGHSPSADTVTEQDNKHLRLNLGTVLSLKTFLPKMRDRRDRGETEPEWYILRRDDSGTPVYESFQLLDSSADENRYVLALETDLGYHKGSIRMQLTNPRPANAEGFLRLLATLLEREKQRQFQNLNETAAA
jgi:hypothetical protein